MTLGEFRKKMVAFSEDALWAEKALDNEDNQFTRRAYIRSLFASIEGTIWILKELILHAPAKNGNVKKLSVAEYALLSDKTYELKSNGEPKEQIKYLKLSENLRFTFNVLSKYFKIEIDLGISTADWNNFIESQKIRNRITHPKHLKDFEISDNDIEICKKTCAWFNVLIFSFFNGLVANIDNATDETLSH